jgi:hypothetical protein
VRNAGRLRHILIAAVATIICLLAVSPASRGAELGEPAWKVGAGVGPTDLPPEQSELQRVTVEAEGGTFELGQPSVEGEGTPVFVEASLSFTAGSSVVMIESMVGVGKVEVGDRLARPEEFGGAAIVACSVDCRTPGSTLELDSPASTTESAALRFVYTRELAGVTGAFHVGEEISKATVQGAEFPFFPPGTSVTEVTSGSITLSNPTTSEYASVEGALELFTPPTNTGLLDFDASNQEVQQALEGLPGIGSGAVRVSGGPGGSVATPYTVAFGGALADQNVAQLSADPSSLSGIRHFVSTSTLLPGGPGTGQIAIYPTNIGGVATQGIITVTVGPLPSGVTFSGPAIGVGWTCTQIAEKVTCKSSAPIAAGGSTTGIAAPIEVRGTAAARSLTEISITGGGAVHGDAVEVPLAVSSRPAEPGIAAFWTGAYDDEGYPATQAGGHPFSDFTWFLVNTVRSGSGQIIPAGDLKDATVDLSPGFVGDPLVTARRCPQGQPAPSGTPPPPVCEGPEATLGELDANFEFGQGEYFHSNLINNIPVGGSAAQFTGLFGVPFASLVGSLRSTEDFGIRVDALHSPSTVQKTFATLAVFNGFPASAAGKAFFRNATDCSAEAANPPSETLKINSWQDAAFAPPATERLPAVTGCDRLHFEPEFTLQPTSTQGSSGVGATARLHLEQKNIADPDELATPDLKRSVVRLPKGLDVNPAQAAGLQACTEAQVGYEPQLEPLPLNPTRFNEDPVSCPDGSKLGTVEATSPLLEEPLKGTIYLAAQEENPFDSLIGLYLVFESRRFGITLKLPGKVETDPGSGQLTAIFDHLPQQPIEDLTLNFRGGGPRSEFSTPEVCGTYSTEGEWEPWSAPESGPPAITSDSFKISSGCSSSLATRPFHPTFEGGAVNPVAGAYSPLVIKVGRADGEKELASINFTLPPGELGKLKGVSYCPEAAIVQASNSTGRQEVGSPSCPAASQIGTVDTTAGVGSEPVHVDGKVFLAGPYKGAPVSAVVVAPAVSGPFDLGDVVIRSSLFVNPETAQITVKSDPIPTILRGIPLKIRSISIMIDRPDFSLNPTNCEAMSISATIGGTEGGSATPTNHFQVGYCGALGFAPKLKLSLAGSTKRTGHPALKAVLTYPADHDGYSNIARAQVNLPHSEFIDQGNLNKVCVRPVLLEGKCPSKSIYGKAKAWTPLLAEPLEGPVYLVGGYGYKLPALVAELGGQIRVVLIGRIDTGPNKGIRNTFESVPDAPVEKFELQLKGGRKYSLLENSESLCAKPQKAIAHFTAQNGRVRQTKPLIANDCRKKRKKNSGKGPKRAHR